MSETDPLALLQQTLRVARLSRGLSMKAVTSRSELSRTTVSQAFNSPVPPTEETLAALAPILRLDLETLLAHRRACPGPSGPISARGGTAKATKPVGPVPEDDVAFETRYRDYVKTRHGELTVVGLDLRGPAASSWPLDAAYLSLELADTAHQGQRVERAEHALRRNNLLLIRGLAGSGKTTLLQWIACAAASGDLPGPDDSPNQSQVAFVLQLRTLVGRREGLPTPEEFLAAVGCPLTGAQPSGWADRVLDSGRAIVLVDGLDEVPELMRERTRTWLRELVAAYKRVRFVVTTRPTAVSEGWLAASGFRELTVRPMSRADVTVFVTRWHTAAKASTNDPEVQAHLAGLEDDLKEQVRTKRDLSLLTTTPLLCALVCALHRDRRGQLPHDRVELYQAALTMFLYRRDHEREVVAPEGITLSEKESVQLLQKLAYWLVRNSQTEMPHDTALAIMAEALKSMHAVAQQGDATQVLNHLLRRSGLLRTPTPDTIDFVHRTFQDFLGAKAAVEARDLPLIARNAHDAQWEDVVRMAVAHAREDERVVLLEAILARSDEDTNRKRLALVALACLRHATELPEATREKVETNARSLLPPQSWQDAIELGSIGPLVLDLMPSAADTPARLARYSIHTAKEIGGDGALAYLKSFSGTRDFGVRLGLCTGWTNFDPDEYVAQVLAPMTGELPNVHVTEVRQIQAIQPLQVTRITLHGNHSAYTIGKMPHPEQIRSLGLWGNSQLPDLGQLTSLFPHLEELRLDGCSRVSGLTSLATTAINKLALSHIPTLRTLGPLERMTELRSLQLWGLDLLTPSRVPALPQLEWLDVDHTGFLSMLDQWPNLTRLSLHGPQLLPRSRVALPARLSHMDLWEVDLGTLKRPRIGWLSQITDATLTTLSGVVAPIIDLFPGVRSLSISAAQSASEVDISPLAELPELITLTVAGFARVTGTEAFAPDVVRIMRP
ncbi:NACHT domain-containing protein [Streptomyces flavotricini]|uniref:NACHT domain-containing protein n=1 Tax=Streptomyces flavotricini TaxID=66888 RepID=A0ABS8EA26_9ACTN|nr:NACHT domain-containing protein [Streptomyces flavotricini]MCC0097774.1 NACHT domain-containing protein [Streptomyces flavotricini]